MAPIVPLNDVSQEINLVIAFLIGLGFGFVLEQAGFSSSRKLVGMFYGYDITVLKVFFTAAITAMLGLLFLNYLGLIDMSIVYVNEYFIRSAIIGGVVMGAGFIIGGFCPGTSVCAAAIGKVDAMFFVAGGLIGILLFGQTYAWWEEIYNADYLGSVKLSDSLGMKDGLLGFIVIVMAIAMFWIGEKAERRFHREDISKEI
jgi:uncharacterized protein